MHARPGERVSRREEAAHATPSGQSISCLNTISQGFCVSLLIDSPITGNLEVIGLAVCGCPSTSAAV